MRCPYCDQEMEKGYIQCRDGVYWRKKMTPVPTIPLGKGIVSLNQEKGMPGFGGDATVAFLCVDCKKIVIDCDFERSV